jgi:hypothetical protein
MTALCAPLVDVGAVDGDELVVDEAHGCRVTGERGNRYRERFVLVRLIARGVAVSPTLVVRGSRIELISVALAETLRDGQFLTAA